MSTLKGPYSTEFHDFVQRCLNQDEYHRASLDDHEKFLRPYQAEATTLKLDFKPHQKQLEGDDFFEKQEVIQTTVEEPRVEPVVEV